MRASGHATEPAQIAPVLEAFPVAVLLALDAGGTDVRTNAAFRALIAGDPSRLVPGPLFFENGKPLRDAHDPLALTLAGVTLRAMRVEVVRSDGSLRSAILSSAPLRRDDGAIHGALIVLQDVDEHVLPGRILRDVSVHTPALLFTTDAAGDFESINARWSGLIGTGADELLGAGWRRFVHPDDRGRVVEEWAAHVASGEPYVSQWRLRRGDGTYRWTEIRAEPQRDERGSVVRWFGSGTDVDAQRRALDALAFLAQGGAAVAWAEDVAMILDRLAHASLEGLADISIFDLQEEDGTFRRVVVSSPTTPQRSVDVTAAFETPKPGEPHPIARAMQSGETIHVADVDEDFIRRSVSPAKRQAAWRIVDIRSMVCAPLMSAGRGIGALTLLRTGTSVPFETPDVKVVEEVARRAAIAIDNIRLKQSEQRASRNLQAFADMGRALAESLGLQQTLDAAMHVIVPERADWAFVTLMADGGDLRIAAVYHQDQAKSLMLAGRIGSLYARAGGSGKTAEVIRARAPVFLEQVNRSSAARVIPEDVLETLMGVGLASVIIVPLYAGTEVRGTLHLCMESSGRSFSSHDVGFFQELARRMAPAIANAELFERAQRVARSFQEAALPLSLPTAPGFAFRAIYEAGKTESLVGGDWYDAFSLADGRIVVSIGDVAGSGLSAAVTMAGVRQAIRGAAHVLADPTIMLEAANQAVLDDAEGRFVTAFAGVIDRTTSTIAYQSAGHLPPLLLLPDGSIVELAGRGLPLGVAGSRPRRNHEARLPAGSLLTLYTDGLVESTHDLLEGERRVHAALADPLVHGSDNPAQMLHDAVLTEGSRDDVAILTIRVG